MVAFAASVASQQVLNKVAQREFTNITREQWGHVSSSSSSSSSNETHQLAADTASTTIQQLIELLSDMMGGVTTSVRRFVTSCTTFLGGHAAVSSDAAPGAGRASTGFTHDQHEALKGLVNTLHQHHSEELAAAHRRTLMLCGVTGVATLSAAAALAWYFSSSSQKQKQKSENHDQNDTSADATTASTTPVKIKTLNFRGNPDALISLLEKMKESKTPVEIEHAVCVASDNDNSVSSVSSFEQHVDGEAPCSPALAGDEQEAQVDRWF